MSTNKLNPNISSQNTSVRNRSGGPSWSKSSPSSSPTITIENELKNRKIKQKKFRNSLILYKKPLSTLYLFFIVLYEYLKQLILKILSSITIILISLPILSIIIIHLFIPQLEIELIKYLYYNIEWIGWWLILGILSSIGLGTGMHSGLLFLFPFIGQVCMVAATCHSLNFETYGTHPFVCLSQNNESSSTVTFWGLFFKVFWPCFLWGSGTAIGEIPPYAVSLAAAKAGKKDEQEEFQDIIDIQNISNKSNVNLFERMKIWMIQCLKLYGFWGVLAFAAWPNMAFDMCGIACGYFEMSFWTFFGATFIGKAIIKINLQSIFFITMFNEKTLNKFIDYIEHFGFEWLANNATEFFEKQRKIILGEKIIEKNKHTPIFKVIWSLFVAAFIITFIASTIQILARKKQKEIDEKNNKQFEESQ